MKTYMVIEYQGIRSLVAKRPKHPTRLYWFGGASYMNDGEDVTTLHTFDPTEDWETEVAIEIAFWRDWNPPKQNGLGKDGWLSPDGSFYRCHYGEHESAADQIVAAFYGQITGSEYLDTHQWLRVQDGNVVLRGNGSPPATQSQIDILWDISRRDDLDDRERRWSARYLKDVTIIV